MKKLLNTLYVTTEDAYLALDGENVVVQQNGEPLGRIPLHTLESVVAFGYVGASPALMGKCAEMNIALVFLKPSGRFLAKVTGKAYGNILLRRAQYRICDDPAQTMPIADAMIAAKLLNCRAVLCRALRDHPQRIAAQRFEAVAQQLHDGATAAYTQTVADALRGLEGECANRYFAVFDEMILQQKEDFFFRTRSRRPPMDNVNALLSFAYSLLTSMCVSALETVGLDPYAGVFHTERPGRCSLALDLMEEFRAPFADRFVLTLINKKMVAASDFVEKENGGVLLTDAGRKSFLTIWQQRKKEVVTHPYLQEKVEWGMLPYIQAMLLAKCVRNDLDGYPAFVWR